MQKVIVLFLLISSLARADSPLIRVIGPGPGDQSMGTVHKDILTGRFVLIFNASSRQDIKKMDENPFAVSGTVEGENTYRVEVPEKYAAGLVSILEKGATTTFYSEGGADDIRQDHPVYRLSIPEEIEFKINRLPTPRWKSENAQKLGPVIDSVIAIRNKKGNLNLVRLSVANFFDGETYQRAHPNFCQRQYETAANFLLGPRDK